MSQDTERGTLASHHVPSASIHAKTQSVHRQKLQGVGRETPSGRGKDTERAATNRCWNPRWDPLWKAGTKRRGMRREGRGGRSEQEKEEERRRSKKKNRTVTQG